VDDLVNTGSNLNLILGLKKQLVDKFEMIDLGMFHLFFGIQVLQKDNNVVMSLDTTSLLEY